MSNIARPNWLNWAMEIQSIAQNGLTFARDPYDIERYKRLRELSAEILAAYSDLPAEKIHPLFCNESGYQTPKLDTRAAIFEDDKILLVQENNGRWSLPGGWVDVLESIASNTVKEVREETGLDVVAERIIAIQDRNLHNPPPYPYGVCKVFVLCRKTGGHFVENIETLGFDYFPCDHLPPLSEEKCTADQIKMCFCAHSNPQWQTHFD